MTMPQKRIVIVCACLVLSVCAWGTPKEDACIKKAKSDPTVNRVIGSLSMKDLCKDAPNADGPVRCFKEVLKDGYMTLVLLSGEIADLCARAEDATPMKCFKDIHPDQSIVGGLDNDAAGQIVFLCGGTDDMFPAKCLRKGIQDYQVGDCSSNCGTNIDTLKKLINSCAAINVQ